MNVVIMVSDGYPLKFSANNSKGEFIAMGLKEAGCKVSMIDNPLGTNGIQELKSGVSENGIPYYILPKNCFWKNIKTIWRVLKETKEPEKNHLLLGMSYLPIYLVTVTIAMILGYKRSTLFHEWHISMKYSNMAFQIEAWLRDKCFGYFLNLIFPISHFLEGKCSPFGKKTFLLPVLASYERKANLELSPKHFTYCGHAGYLLRNTLLLDAFKLLIEDTSNQEISLQLVLVGNSEQLDDVNKMITTYGLTSCVSIKSQLPQSELYKIYDSSIGLIIPLDPSSLQDTARFSQKIAEYVASKRPIITNSVGEIPYYFKHMESAVIVPYDAMGFYSGMDVLLKNKQLSDEIGLNGFVVGMNSFNYKVVGRKVKEIMESL